MGGALARVCGLTFSKIQFFVSLAYMFVLLFGVVDNFNVTVLGLVCAVIVVPVLVVCMLLWCTVSLIVDV